MRKELIALRHAMEQSGVDVYVIPTDDFHGSEYVGDYFRCAYRSLAESYAKALKELECGTRRTYDKLYIVGGGAKNDFLNRLTAEATGKQVIALPMEATALGNLKIQMEVL